MQLESYDTLAKALLSSRGRLRNSKNTAQIRYSLSRIEELRERVAELRKEKADADLLIDKCRVRISQIVREGSRRTNQPSVIPQDHPTPSGKLTPERDPWAPLDEAKLERENEKRLRKQMKQNKKVTKKLWESANLSLRQAQLASQIKQDHLNQAIISLNEAIRRHRNLLSSSKAKESAELNAVEHQLKLLLSRGSEFSRVFSGPAWKFVFGWGYLLQLDQVRFDELLRKVGQLKEFVASSMGTSSQRQFGATLDPIIDDLVELQLEPLIRQLSEIPRLPPAANTETQDIVLSMSIKLNNEIVASRSALAELWPRDVKRILAMFS